MNQTDQQYPIALRGRKRPRFYAYAMLAIILGLGLLPVLNMAQASRHSGASPREIAAYEAETHDERFHTHAPNGISLGALIEAKKLARQRLAAYAPSPSALPVGSDAWEAQFGAFSSPDAAERQRVRIAETGAAVVLPLIVRDTGALYRLQSVPAPSRALAAALCMQAQAHGVDCFIRRVSTVSRSP